MSAWVRNKAASALAVTAAVCGCSTVTIIDGRERPDEEAPAGTGGASPGSSGSSNARLAASSSASVTAGAGGEGQGGSASGLLTVLATGLTQPAQIEVVGDDLYVTETGLFPGDGALARVPKQGGALERVVPNQAHPWGLSVADGYVYWSNASFPGAVLRLSITDGAVDTLVDGLDTPTAVAFDAGVLFTAEIFTGRILGVHADFTVDEIATGQGHPFNIAADGGVMVFHAAPNSEGPHALRRYEDGVVSDLYADVAEPRGLIVDGDDVYFGTVSGELIRGSTSGAPLETLVSLGEEIFDTTIADGYLYFAALWAGSVGRVPTGGGPVEIIATDQGILRGIAVDDDAIYWAREDSGGPVEQAGSVVRLTK